jgi:OCT family organic cation transporter-like MFS transporter 4/5
MVSKGFVTVGFSSIYVFTSELFPTEVRNVGVGSASMCARVGGMIAPYMGPSLVTHHLFLYAAYLKVLFTCRRKYGSLCHPS